MTLFWFLVTFVVESLLLGFIGELWVVKPPFLSSPAVAFDATCQCGPSSGNPRQPYKVDQPETAEKPLEVRRLSAFKSNTFSRWRL